MRKNNNQEYKQYKKKLINITPNCLVKYRSFKTDEDFNRNFICSSGYIYFDIDSINDVESYKLYFIEKYGDIVSMVSKSSSCGGLNVLIKISNQITSKDQFFQVWDKIRLTILKDEKVDLICKDFGRSMFISFDPDVFVNYENEITVDVNLYNDNNSNNIRLKNKKSVKQPISYEGGINRLNYTFSDLPNYFQVISKIKIKTTINVINSIIDYNPIEYVDITFPNPIKDGTKHSIYTVIIHKLIYLNPDIEIKYLFSYLNFINNHFASPPMEYRELNRLFNHVYNITQIEEYKFEYKRIKNFHFNPSIKMDKEIKKSIINDLNGKLKINCSIEKIQSARCQLELEGMKVTQKEVSKISGLSLRTVKTHYRKSPIDINELVDLYNNSVDVTGINKIDFKSGFSSKYETKPQEEYIHPDCPQWVLSYMKTGVYDNK